MALIESKKYFRCHHCGSFAFPEPIEIDGVRIVGRTAESSQCPLCKLPMDHAVLDDRHSVHFCAKCRGMLFPRDTFAGVVQHRRAWATTPAVKPPPLDARAYDRALNCPLCGKRFMTYPYGGPGAVVIDGCEDCNVLWLDYRELTQIVDAPGPDRGGREQVRRGEEYEIIPKPAQGPHEMRTDPFDFIFSLLG